MMLDDEDYAKIAKNFVIGADLSECSIEELQNYITILEQEIIRIRESIDQKQDTMSAAHKLFNI